MNKPYRAQWRDENAEIEYPFLDESFFEDDDGLLVIENSWLVDAAIYAPQATPPVSIASISVKGTVATITLVDNNFNEIGSGNADRFSTNPIAIRDERGLPVATLVPGELANEPIFIAGDGDYLFSSGALMFVPSVVLSGIAAGVSGFSAGDRKTVSNPLVIVAERGVQISHRRGVEFVVTNPTRRDVDILTIHVTGDTQAEYRKCNDRSRLPGNFLQEIVFQYGDKTIICGPDDVGNVVISAQSPSTPNSALKVQNANDELLLRLSGKGVSHGS
ncbi:MAG: hypothetical protein KatS3mg109_0009 [Pirellulaceae bacterium]|nr:MAG: hypothetical protein KatS3mg109_0009 [Pirellulaceae bacterium]